MINRISLWNLGLHERLDCEFGPGLNVIIGKNGSGKSTVVKSGLGALTNDWSRFAGVKADNVRQGSRGRSGVELQMTHAGNKLTVGRRLDNDARSNHTLLFNGEEKHKEVEVNARVLEILGISEWVLSELLFIPQGGVCNLMSLTTAKRSERFQHLFGLSNVRSAWKALGDEAAAVKASGEDAGLEFLEAEIRRFEQDLAKLVSDEQRLVDKVGDASLAKVDQALASLLELERISRDIQLKAETKGSALLQKMNHEQTDARLGEDEQTLREVLGGEIEKANIARAVLARMAQVAEAQQRLKGLHDEATKIHGTLDSYQPPAQAPGYIKDTDAQWLVETEVMRAQATERRRFLKKFDPALRLTACPECGSPADHLQTRWKDEKAAELSAGPILAEREAAWKMSRDYDGHVSRDEIMRKSWVDKLSGVSQRIADLEKLIGMGGEPASEAELRQQVVSTEEMQQALDTIVSERMVLADPLFRARATCENTDRDIDRLQEERTKVNASLNSLFPGGHVPSVASLQTQRVDCLALRDAAADRLRVSASLESTRTRLKEASLANQTRARKIEWSTKCERMRGTLNYDELPAKVVRHSLARIAGPLNQHLHTLEAPYQVVAEADCSFSVVKDTGEHHTAARLSDGELLVLSVSLILALVDTYAAGLGFLVLDEPTAHLDKANVRGFSRLLEKVQKNLHSQGSQIIIVTHEPELARTADRVIDLDARK